MHLAIKGWGVDVGKVLQLLSITQKCTQTVKFEILYYNNS